MDLRIHFSRTYVRQQTFLAVVDVGDRDFSLGHVHIIVYVVGQETLVCEAFQRIQVIAQRHRARLNNRRSRGRQKVPALGVECLDDPPVSGPRNLPKPQPKQD